MLIAEDNADSTITTKQRGHDYQYLVAEFPPVLITPILMAATLITIIAARRRKLHMKSSRT
jgi:hypothetical protein